MSRIRPVALGLGLALALAAGAGAQIVDKKVLTFAAAQKIAAAAADAARARGVGVVIAVVDDGGHLILLHRLDDTQVASVNVGIGTPLSRLAPGNGRGLDRRLIVARAVAVAVSAVHEMALMACRRRPLASPP